MSRSLLHRVAGDRLDDEQVLARHVSRSQNQPAGLTGRLEDRPGDRGVQGQVGELVENLIEPAAEGRAGPLKPCQAAVGGVEDQRRRQGQGRTESLRDARCRRMPPRRPPRA